MLLVDPRAGSADYAPRLRDLGATVELVQMDAGDVAFYGSGHAVGIELKKLGDLLNCITTGRFSGHQLPGLARDYTEAWLVVEGLWRPAADGVLETWQRGGWMPVKIGKRRWMWRELDAFLNTIEIKGGVRVKRTTSEDETARVVYGLYQWWQTADSHRSHLALNRAGRDQAIFIKPTFARRVAAELPGVGFERSAAVAEAFPTVRAMIEADEQAWMRVDGIGKKLAKGIVESWDSAS